MECDKGDICEKVCIRSDECCTSGLGSDKDGQDVEISDMNCHLADKCEMNCHLADKCEMHLHLADNCLSH